MVTDVLYTVIDPRTRDAMSVADPGSLLISAEVETQLGSEHACDTAAFWAVCGTTRTGASGAC